MIKGDQNMLETCYNNSDYSHIYAAVKSSLPTNNYREKNQERFVAKNNDLKEKLNYPDDTSSY